MNFSDLGLAPEFAQRLEARGITAPTPIQAEVFASVAEGKSVLGFAKTGTGKTLAYMSPLIQRVSMREKAATESPTRVVALVPTRELAVQVFRDLEMLTGDPNRGVVIVGGESEGQQITGSLKAEWLIATPGRLLDLLRRRAVDVSNVSSVVFDEADRLLDMGFVDDMRAIMKFLPRENLQMLFFTATVHFGVDEMAYEFGVDEIMRFGTETDELTVEGLDHKVSFIGEDEKFHALVHMVQGQGNGRGIVFSNYREKARMVASRLQGLGLEVAMLTAQLAQNQRNSIMEQFRSGKIRVLVASDLAARGLDIFDIDFVVNYDIPEDPATYVHRVGRTARAGRKGIAVSFVGYEDAYRLEKLERFLGKPIERLTLEIAQLSGSMPRLGTARPQAYSDAGEEGPRPQSHSAKPRRPAPHARDANREFNREGNREVNRDDSRSGPNGRPSDRPEERPENARHQGPPRAAHQGPSPRARQEAQPKSPAAAAPSPSPQITAPKGLWGRVKAFVTGLLGMNEGVAAAEPAKEAAPRGDRPRQHQQSGNGRSHGGDRGRQHNRDSGVRRSGGGRGRGRGGPTGRPRPARPPRPS